MTPQEIMQGCKATALHSPCQKGKVGACIFGEWGDGTRFYGWCYSSPRSEPIFHANTLQRVEEWLPDLSGKKHKLICESGCLCGKAVHAEMKALDEYLWAESEACGYRRLPRPDTVICYTTTFPCRKCLKELIEHGVDRIVIGLGESAKEEADSAALYQALEEGLLEEVRFV